MYSDSIHSAGTEDYCVFQRAPEARELTYARGLPGSERRQTETYQKKSRHEFHKLKRTGEADLAGENADNSKPPSRWTPLLGKDRHEFRAGFAGRRSCVVNIKNPLFFFRPGFSLPLLRMDKERTKT